MLEEMTGKCRSFFKTHFELRGKIFTRHLWQAQFRQFKTIPAEMQKGVIFKWFKSFGIHIEISRSFDPVLEVPRYYFTITNDKSGHISNFMTDNKPISKTEEECEKRAVATANLIWNKNNYEQKGH